MPRSLCYAPCDWLAALWFCGFVATMVHPMDGHLSTADDRLGGVNRSRRGTERMEESHSTDTGLGETVRLLC